MAFLTSCYCVHAYQRETGQIVVKQNVFIPARLVMTVIAGAALFAFVCIIFLVAADAVGLQLILIQVALVAVITGNILVFSK